MNDLNYCQVNNSVNTVISSVKVSAQQAKSSVPYFICIGNNSDLYPTVKFRRQILQQHYAQNFEEFFVPIGQQSISSSLFNNVFTRALTLSKFLWAHFFVWVRCLVKQPEVVYVAYPSIFVTFLFSFYPQKIRPKIVIDAFISIYDTVVQDRHLFASSTLRAKLLFFIESRAFNTAHLVIVDTVQNQNFYASLFKINKSKFTVMPLSIPEPNFAELNTQGQMTSSVIKNEKCRCLFIGTMVPLQGVRRIINAAYQLEDNPEIEFTLIGDGQEADLIQKKLESHHPSNLKWIRSLVTTEEMYQHIQASDLCCGIFGSGEKTQRVIPYKIYHYLAHGKPVLTLKTRAIQQLANDGQSPFILTDYNDLAEKIRMFANNRLSWQGMSESALQIFQTQLSYEIVKDKFLSIFEKIYG